MRSTIVRSLALLVTFLCAACAPPDPPATAFATASLVPHPTTIAIPATVTSAPKPERTTWRGHYKDFGFRGHSVFRLKPGNDAGGEDDVFSLLDRHGNAWAIDLDLEFKGKRYLYAAQVSPSAKRKCGPWLEDFTNIPKRCVVRELIVEAPGPALAWLRSRYGKKVLAAGAGEYLVRFYNERLTVPSS